MHPGAPVTELTVPSGALFFALLPAPTCARIKDAAGASVTSASAAFNFFRSLIIPADLQQQELFRAHCSHIS